MNEKIATQLAQMDKLMFDLRMSLTALQSELHQSATYSTTVPTTTLFDSPESQVEPDGFHGKSYKDFERSQEWKNALCAVKTLSVLTRQLSYGFVKTAMLIPNVYGVRPS